MRRAYIFIALITFSIGVRSQSIDSLSRLRMDSLIAAKRIADRKAELEQDITPSNPYAFRLLLPGTLYNSTLTHTLGIRWQPEGKQPAPKEEAHLLVEAIDRQYARLYVTRPSLVGITEEHILQEPRLKRGVEEPLGNEVRLTDMVVPVDLSGTFNEPVIIQPHRPRFWTVKGSGSLQATQSYYSDNWYQGGEANYAALSTLTIEADFDNQQKLQWDNKLELQLGFQTSSDTVHQVKVTSNLLRYTTSLGYQAAKDWYYTCSLVSYTQLMRYYDTNAYTYSTQFASPLDITLSLGMTYKFETRGGKFSGSLQLSPIAYNMRYVGVDSLREHYSVPDGKNAYHNFGPSLSLSYTLQLLRNVSWESRLYYFTNLSYVDLEWENTFSFTINRYLSAKLFVYPRFDDSSPAYKGRHGYLMLKQWLSLGLSFDF
ncbi:MAG: DUF3078 domain-containing protein [Prevotellaceae bacterium]|nr:DUF3078 domain-containing protein [Prevotellaceae bacterium]